MKVVGWLRPFPGGDSLTRKSFLAAEHREQLFLALLPAARLSVPAGRSREGGRSFGRRMDADANEKLYVPSKDSGALNI